MRLLVFSDVHADWRALERLLATEADYYVAAGDLVSWARNLDKAGEMLSRRAGKVAVIPGNHESEDDIERMCSQYGLRNLHGSFLTLEGFEVAGLGYSNPTPFQTPGEYPESEFERRLASFAGLRPLILICHCPPQGTLLDRAGEGRHFGSSAVRAFVEKEQPDWFFCGHIHEAEGAETAIGRTRAVNVGKRGYLLEWHDAPLLK